MRQTPFLLHARRNGHFDVYLPCRADKQEALPAPIHCVSSRDFCAKLPTMAAQAGIWRVIAQHTDPHSVILDVPVMGRRDRRDFMAVRLRQFNPDASWRLAVPEAGRQSRSAILHTLPDCQDEAHALLTCLQTLVQQGHQISSLHLFGQIWVAFSRAPGLSSPARQGLLSLLRPYLPRMRKPPAGEDLAATLWLSPDTQGQWAILEVEGQCRFTRFLSADEAKRDTLLTHLLPTLLTHRFLSRAHRPEIRETGEGLLPMLTWTAHAGAGQLPPSLLASSSGLPPIQPRLEYRSQHYSWLLHQKKWLWSAVALAHLLCVGFVWEGWQRQTAAEHALHQLLSSNQGLMPPDDLVWLGEVAGDKSCPNPVETLRRVSSVLVAYPKLKLHSIRWLCIRALADKNRQLQLNLYVDNPAPVSGSPDSAMTSLQARLSTLGEVRLLPNPASGLQAIEIALSWETFSP